MNKTSQIQMRVDPLLKQALYIKGPYLAATITNLILADSVIKAEYHRLRVKAVMEEV